MTQLPYPGQEYGMGIPSDAEIQQVADGLLSAIYRDYSLRR